MKITPIRQQYLNIKKRYSDIIVFFRLGDFYETFDEDARIVSEKLQIALTSRELGKGYRVPMAGIPYHALESYLGKLINCGLKIAICEQLTQPGKGLIERDVIRIITPGTIYEPGILKDKNNNYLASVLYNYNSLSALAYVDISTGEFRAAQLENDQLFNELVRISPSEIILPNNTNMDRLDLNSSITFLDTSVYDYESACNLLYKYFGTNVDELGLGKFPLIIKCAGSILNYAEMTQRGLLKNIQGIDIYSVDSYMVLDADTRRNLEIFLNTYDGTQTNSLISIIDITKTAMGGRLIKKWLGQPLLDVHKIKERQDIVDYFFHHQNLRHKSTELLQKIFDIERIINRVKNNLATTGDLIKLSTSLQNAILLRDLLSDEMINTHFWNGLDFCEDVIYVIKKAIAEDGDYEYSQSKIKSGFSDELDKYRQMVKESRKLLQSLEKKERERTGIKSLKIQYNSVFGYYLEVSKSNINLVPSDYIRKQTLVNCERYYTPELKQYEIDILTAQQKMQEVEEQLFRNICSQVSEKISAIIKIANAIANLDVLVSLAEVAAKYNYVRPIVDESDQIIIKNGRHPVIERTIGEDSFIPNDTRLNTNEDQIIILTGPNMSGKSTYIKQVALITLLAQVGSFVPAEGAVIGVVDRIFTRIGAQENLAAGRSTFMVEMLETANILSNATPRSLIILDEVGRGTSTYDGLSIAWAVIEYIHNNPMIKAKTLFATHYHELINIAEYLPRVRNYCVSVIEENGKIIFLHKIAHGGIDKSYGVHVAELAGLPPPVINRAREILKKLEYKQVNIDFNKCAEQLKLFTDEESQIVYEIKKIDINTVTPLDALNILYRLKLLINNHN